MSDNGGGDQGSFTFTPRFTREQAREFVLRELRAEVDATLKPGMPAINCKVCGQRVKLYRRKLHSGMAYALVRLRLHDHQHPGEFMDYRDYKARGESRNHPYMRFWGLIEPKPDQLGHWRITDLGRRFVDTSRTGSEIAPMTVPHAIWHFNNRCYGFTLEETTLRRALGDHFDLDELLASMPNPHQPGDDFFDL